MKKYMKPIMESEAFVSNEYIGACYWVDCDGCNIYDKVFQISDQATNPYAYAADAFKNYYGGSIYSGSSDNTFIYDNSNKDNNGCCKENCAGQSSSLSPFWQWVLNFLGIGDWTKTNIAHHHLTVTKTNLDNYPEHPNHS